MGATAAWQRIVPITNRLFPAIALGVMKDMVIDEAMPF
jgi:hypothetical protein